MAIVLPLCLPITNYQLQPSASVESLNLMTLGSLAVGLGLIIGNVDGDPGKHPPPSGDEPAAP